MNLPNLIDRRLLATLAAPDETHCVRVILPSVGNAAPYSFRSRLRKYVFEKDPAIGMHVLDFPVSVWMANLPTGQYRKNVSVSDDLKPHGKFAFTIQVIPWQGAKPIATEAAPDVFPLLRELMARFNPPPVLLKALDLARTGDVEGIQALLSLAKQAPANSEATSAEESPAAARMRKMREAKAAKKAQLQPA